MARLMTALAGGVLIGVLAMLAITRFDAGSNPAAPAEVVRDIASVPAMTPAVATKHREERYASLTSVEQVLALPTAFARSEALHLVAGRSNAAVVQTLIFEANRVADDIERVRLLDILFYRLAEMDPPSALAIARSSPFNQVKSEEQTVWYAWARNDLDEALFAAKTQTTNSRQKAAAQSLFAAFGFMGNDTTQRIATELGIEPDNATRSRYLYQLADRSPTEAIAFINGLGRSRDSREYVSWLAAYLAREDLDDSIRYADLLDLDNYREHFKAIVNRERARENPQAVLESLLSGGSNDRSHYEYRTAIAALAETDMDAAVAYFEQARSRSDRQAMASAIVDQMALNDPAAALIWARENERDEYPQLEMRVLSQLVQTDPERAFAEALKSPGASMRSMLVSNIVQQLVRSDPAGAASYLERIPGEAQRQDASRSFAMTWMRQDAAAAVDWIIQQDDETRDSLTRVAVQVLPEMDIDAAMRMLPKLDDAQSDTMRQRIAQVIAINQSSSEALAFIQQYAGQPGYDELQASVITGIARTDTIAAKQLADQLAAGKTRDRAYVDIISRRAQSHPSEAASWLQRVGDEGLRGAAAGRLVSNWYEQDAAAATRWATGLPVGAIRDDAIMHMASHWRSPGSEEMNLVNSIDNRDKRGQAKVRMIYHFIQSDPARAQELLDDPDIPDHHRQQLELSFSRRGL